MLISSNYYIK